MRGDPARLYLLHACGLEEVLMLKQISLYAAIFTVMAVVYQGVLGWIFPDTQPLWRTDTVVLLAAVGGLSGYFNSRRRQRQPGN